MKIDSVNYNSVAIHYAEWMPARKTPKNWHDYITDDREMGGRLWARMVEEKVSPNALAEVLGVSVNAVSQLLKGKANDMKSKNLFKAADFLGLEPRWLGTGNGHRLVARAPERRVLMHGREGQKQSTSYKKTKVRTVR